MSGENLRLAVVGLGKMGLLQAGILNVLPNVQLTAFCDKGVIIHKFFKKVFNGVHVVDDVEKLSDLDLDAVYVTTRIRACIMGYNPNKVDFKNRYERKT